MILHWRGWGLSVFLLFILGIVEFGTALYSWNTMQLAVEHAGRYAMVNNTTVTPAIAEAQMQTVLPTAAVCTTPSAGEICVNASTAAGSPPTITLTAKYNFNFLALAGSFILTSEATFPLD